MILGLSRHAAQFSRKPDGPDWGAGIHFWGNLEQQSRWFELGANLLIHSADITLFEKHLKLELSEIKQAVGLVGEPLSQLAIETVV